ncbi:hypothetical protein [Nocardioides sp. MH1]|uniref:hypothetical protein n=1 Tax=Nocardioides sp. MH1 TaxID=3242490 RepID=UPI00352024CD
MALYGIGTLGICALAGITGEAFFPVELIGDTGRNDMAGLALIIWSFYAFVLCVLAASAWEVRLWMLRRRR